jgi:L-aspartate oxidase
VNFDTRNLPPVETDVLVVGSGISGLFAALNLKNSLKVTLISKEGMTTNNSYLAQGGIAVAFDEEDIARHIEDTLKAGSYYNDPTAVKVLVEEGRRNVERLMNYGVTFDQVNGRIDLTREGGHSTNRIIHKKDYTGKAIIDQLIQTVTQRSNIDIYENAFLVDVLTREDKIQGALVIFDQELCWVVTNHIVLATGGIGRIFSRSTNSSISTGDGIAVAHRAGARVEDMEFIQFHPTPLKGEGETFLISEAVRGEGGRLRNAAGETFMDKYHPLGDLAPRDVVSRSILMEQESQGNDDIFIDVTHFEKGVFSKRFPSIYQACLKVGIDPEKNLIPVSPSEHYLMGGIVTDLCAKTSIKGLYSCGESARTGVQGANRLASNSLSEGIVFGYRVARFINQSTEFTTSRDHHGYHRLKELDRDFKGDIAGLKGLMDQSANILRSRERLKSAKEAIRQYDETYLGLHSLDRSFLEFKNMIEVSRLIVTMALERKESLGSHYIEEEQ